MLIASSFAGIFVIPILMEKSRRHCHRSEREAEYLVDYFEYTWAFSHQKRNSLFNTYGSARVFFLHFLKLYFLLATKGTM